MKRVGEKVLAAIREAAARVQGKEQAGGEAGATVVAVPVSATSLEPPVEGEAEAEAGAPQPLLYTIVVVPAATPVTRPAASIVAVPGILLLHVPPVEASAKDVVVPGQATGVPDMATGAAFTVSA